MDKCLDLMSCGCRKPRWLVNQESWATLQANNISTIPFQISINPTISRSRSAQFKDARVEPPACPKAFQSNGLNKSLNRLAFLNLFCEPKQIGDLTNGTTSFLLLPKSVVMMYCCNFYKMLIYIFFKSRSYFSNIGLCLQYRSFRSIIVLLLKKKIIKL